VPSRAHFVLDRATHYRCGKALDGKSRTKSNSLRVRLDVAEQIILKPIVDELLAPDVVSEMVTEIRAYPAGGQAPREIASRVPNVRVSLSHCPHE
jgi:hypothetical protein